jgi:hypothetical protein
MVDEYMDDEEQVSSAKKSSQTELKAEEKAKEKAARDKAERGATSKIEGGVKVTQFPPVENTKRPVSAQMKGSPLFSQLGGYRAYKEEGGGGRGEGTSAGSLLRQMNPQKLYKKGGKVSSASSRGDGCAQRGKTKGRMV